MLEMITKAFDEAYFEKERTWSVNTYPKELVEKGSAKIKPILIKPGRLSGYMYRTFSPETIETVGLFINNQVWMSITPMEVESHYLPIQFAEGKVGVGGLGLGYYVNRILDSTLVDEVHVYETNEDVIALYLEQFCQHEKLTIHNEDVLDLKGESFSFFYMDIYADLLSDDVLPDMKKMLNANDIEHYHFWGMEVYVVTLMNSGEKVHIPYGDMLYKAFVRDYVSENRIWEMYLDNEVILEQIEEMDLEKYFFNV